MFFSTAGENFWTDLWYFFNKNKTPPKKIYQILKTIEPRREKSRDFFLKGGLKVIPR